MILLLLALALPALAWTFLLWADWPVRTPRASALTFVACLATGLGVGAFSCAFFLSSAVVGLQRSGLLVLEATALVGMAVLGWRRLTTAGSSP